MHKKTQPNISFSGFMKLVNPVAAFKSVGGRPYVVKELNGNTMIFERKTTGEIWNMDLKKVHQAYKELKDFKTKNFAPYVPRRHSPALGLLLHVGLLE
jgi:hypothetical protein